MIPTTRDDFKKYCLRKLGADVIKINVSEEQIDDRVDEALSMFTDYHMEATEQVYYKYQVTPTDIANKYITLPQNIVGAIKIFDVGTYTGVDYMFNVKYQIALNDMWTLTSAQLTPYYMAQMQLANIQDLLIGIKPIRYNKISNKLYIDTDWNIFPVNSYLIVVAYQVLDPATYTAIWSERWLQNYCTALIKLNWGSNLIKYDGQVMLGGVTFNGQKIYDQAEKDVKKLERDLIVKFSEPLGFFVG